MKIFWRQDILKEKNLYLFLFSLSFSFSLCPILLRRLSCDNVRVKVSAGLRVLSNILRAAHTERARDSASETIAVSFGVIIGEFYVFFFSSFSLPFSLAGDTTERCV